MATGGRPAIWVWIRKTRNGSRPMTENHMQFPQKAPGFPQWNLNTLVQLVGLFLIAITAAGVWFGLRGDVQGLKDWKTEHEGEAKDRRGEIEADLARLGTQGATLDDRLDAQEAITSRLSDRVSAGEARRLEDAQTLRELQSAINQQSGDIRVIRSWIESQPRPGGKP